AIQKVIQRRPIHCARLCLHHPEVLALEAASQIMGESVVCGINVAGANIIIPGRKGERLVDLVMIESVKESHEVTGNELAWLDVLTDYIDLILLVGSPGIGDEAFPLEHQPGI